MQARWFLIGDTLLNLASTTIPTFPCQSRTLPNPWPAFDVGCSFRLLRFLSYDLSQVVLVYSRGFFGPLRVLLHHRPWRNP